ncbi:LysR family transcriptional regulator [Pelotomaculum propionicicum]|uniref:LysR family transcriptional regulator n=1 Tax=Pelotomaculum propionicicum TaxID=258475 RepID=UPI0016BC2F2C|nr:LysR family transcriptional regulator [Pelotomaculum propionicicum]NLI12745.1 LysR family transcriptional regulator [Peptococcaceae bacterium]
MQQLRTFCAVVEEMSFRRAAERLYMAQASVSQQIAALEQYYGVTLFSRPGRRCSVTPEGRALYDWAMEVLTILDTIPQKLTDMRCLAEGQLAIGASTLAGSYLLPPVIRRFKEIYPHIRLSVQTGYGYEMVERVRTKNVDLALVGENLNWTADTMLDFRPVATDRMSLVVWPGHPWCGRAMVEPLELTKGDVFIHSRPGSAMRSMVEKFFHRENISISTLLELGNHETIKRAVEEHVGISLISSISIQSELKNNQLVEVPMARLESIRRNFVLVSLRHQEDSYAELAFIELLTGMIPDAASFSCAD